MLHIGGMELRHLRYFVGVADELHFGRAARRLGISQPPLSQQIRALEDELGVALFERTSRQVTLTGPGRLFLIEARKTLAQAAQAIDIARRAQQGEVGEVSVGFSSSVPFTAVVVEALSAFRETRPAVRLNLTEMPRGDQIEALIHERIDIAFVRGFETPSLSIPITVRLLLTEPLLVAMRSDHPLAARGPAPRIDDLRDVPFVLYQRTFGVGFNEHLTQLCARAGFAPRVVQEATGLSTLLGLVAAGMGITVITRSLSMLHPENVVFRTLDDPEAQSKLWLLHRSRLSTPAQAFVDLIGRGAE